MFSPVNRNQFAFTITPVVGYPHPSSQGKGSSRNSASVQFNERDVEPFKYSGSNHVTLFSRRERKK